MTAGFLRRTLVRVIQPTCGHCQTRIEPDDVNLSKGTLLCRACGRVSYLHSGQSANDPVSAYLRTWTPDRPPPSPGRRSRVNIQETGDRLLIHCRRGSVFGTVFLLVWLTIWTGGCFALIKQTLNEPTTEHILFTIPFLVGWIAGTVTLLVNLLARESLEITPEGIAYCFRVLIPLSRRSYPADQIKSVGGFVTSPDSESGRRQYGIRIETKGTPIRFGKGLPEQSLIAVSDRLARRIRPDIPAKVEAGDGIQEAGSDGATGSKVEVLRPMFPPPASPPDAGIHLRREINLLRVHRRPQVPKMLALSAVLLFAALFWNGIVSIFLLQLVREFHWFQAIFLTPFVLIGLLLAGASLAALLAPLSQEEWEFHPSRIEKRWSLLGIGRTRYSEYVSLDRLELRMNNRTRRITSTDSDVRPDRRYGLHLVGTDGEELVEIGDLTEAEARWLAGELFQDFKSWLVRVRQA